MNISTRNFNVVAPTHRDWVVGHFMDQKSPLRTNDLEVKWAVNKAGDRKVTPAKNSKAKTLTILIKGSVTLEFKDRNIILNKEGDYVFYNAGILHSWIVQEDSLTITIRWPSLPGDQITE